MIFLPAASLQVTIVSAFFGAALATAFILVLASFKHGLTPVYIALAGTAVSAVFLAVTQVLVVFFDVAQELSYWTAGGHQRHPHDGNPRRRALDHPGARARRVCLALGDAALLR